MHLRRKWILGLVLMAALAANAHAQRDGAAQCLARTVYFEARGDGVEGMEAVAAVVMNRVRHRDFPNSVCAVVKQGGETPPCQFSYWCDGRSDRPGDAELWQIAQGIARRALAGELPDPVDGALFFHTEEAGSPFGGRRKYVGKVGSHLFYR
ncbi:MAG: cell wall hydrolase [Ectothiorhodospiraceae bacterium]|jgi:spore germination cell wall hydrolase CwlJ-like protein